MPSSADRATKRARLAAIGRGPVLLTSHEALTWYLEGARTHISLAAGPVLAVRADVDGDVLFIPENEADRMIAEELLPEDAANVVRVPWHASPAEVAAQAGPSTPESAIAHELRVARASLLPAELDRYRALGADAARVLTDVLVDATPEHSEFAVAAALAEGLTAVGAEATVLLVAGASRLSHRHPLPTEAPLGDRAMAVVCARRNGLIANVTRWIGAAHDGDDRILEVEADTFDATVPGARLVDLLDVIVRSYPTHGFSQDEWLLHHQGGPTGYAGRDPRVVPGVPDVVVERQAFAWNPTGPGVKVEDTVVVTADGVEVLSVDDRWPTVDVRGRRRPAVRPFS